MRTAAIAALALLLEALRMSILGRLPFYPDFFLGVVVLTALVRKPPAGAAMGFVLGALRDWTYGGPLGVETLALTLIGWGVGSAGKAIYREAAITQSLMMLAGGLARGAFVYLAATRLDSSGLFRYLLYIALPGAVLTAILVPLLYHYMPAERSRRLSEREKKLLLEQLQ